MAIKTVNILVTGSAGYLGSPLCFDLLELGHNVVGIDNYIASNDQNTIKLKKYFKDDLSDDSSASRAFFSLASKELNTLLNFRMSSKRLDNLFRCYEHFITLHKRPSEMRRMPNYFMYNPNILKTQKTLIGE